MAQDFRYALTRMCLKAGQLTLPQKMLEVFPKDGTVTGVDSTRNQEFKITAEARNITGLSGFFKLHNLEVNDEVIIRPLEDGRYSFTPYARPRKPDYSKPTTLKTFLDELAEQATPLSEAEIRDVYPDLPGTFNIAELLNQDTRFSLEAGRWQTTRSKELTDVQDDKTKRASVTPYPRNVIFPSETLLNSQAEPADVSTQHKAKDILVSLGYRVESLSYGQLLAHSELGRRHYSVLVQVLSEGDQVDWTMLLAKRRETTSTYAAVFGHPLDLTKLSAPAAMARATLWSWTALERLSGLSGAVLLSPFDLESFFERDGLFEHGYDRFEKMVDKRIVERGAFSAVLTQLAAMRAPVVFMLDEVTDNDLSREQALKVLDVLSQAPFHLITKVDNGEFCLRSKVNDALLNFSDYALSLRSRLPQRRTERIQALETTEDLETSLVEVGAE
jgi:hypothetical protein